MSDFLGILTLLLWKYDSPTGVRMTSDKSKTIVICLSSKRPDSASGLFSYARRLRGFNLTKAWGFRRI